MARNLAINKLKEFIENEDICERIEESIYQYTIEKARERCLQQDICDKYFRRIYVNKLHQIYTNLNADSYVKNEYFLDRILSEEFDLDRLAFLSPQELNHEHWKDMVSKQQAGEEFISKGANLGTKTREYTCSRCKGNDCYTYSVCSRSLDEAPITHVICQCGKKWKFS